jgi:hypothetical protein
MSWDIKVWHDDMNGRARMCIEAGVDVPDDVISSIASSYWLEEVQYFEPEWDETEGDTGAGGSPGSKLQG